MKTNILCENFLRELKTNKKHITMPSRQHHAFSYSNSCRLAATYTGWPQKIWHTLFLYALTSSNIDRFSNLFHCQNQEIRNNLT